MKGLKMVCRAGLIVFPRLVLAGNVFAGGVDAVGTITGHMSNTSMSIRSTISLKEMSVPNPAPSTAQPPPPTQSAPPIQSPTSNTPETQPKEDESVKNIQVTVGNKTFSATLAENTATQAFVELMKAAPVVINMNDHGGFEKVGALGSDLPTSNNYTTTQSGDIVLYNTNQIVIFYGTNTWNYTRLGKMDDLFGFEEALGNGDVTVTFSIE